MEEKKCFPSAKQNGAAGLFSYSHQIPAEPCKIGSELRKEAEGLAWNKDLLCSHFTRDMYEPEFFHLQN
jgi:hypothetical protein